MELNEFIEKKKFGGIDILRDGFLVMLDGKTYKIREDESDGYRSYLDDVEEVDYKPNNTFDEVDVTCVYKKDNYYDVVQIYDSANNKLILEFGTEDWDDYYPTCILDWSPENMSINENR